MAEDTGRAFAVVAVFCGLLGLIACNRGKDEAMVTEEAEQATTSAVVTLASGLQYEVIEPGTGDKPGPTDRVTVHYRGTLLDGREFDSSYKRNQPSVFPVNRVIKGWTEALQLMREGAKWKLTIPPELAYGKRGAGKMIGPDETLVFEVELIKVN
ncbi:MAG: FKBP-type peptidyl-prolyl cis-trans isomerase [Candidatus Binatia bacterium]